MANVVLFGLLGIAVMVGKAACTPAASTVDSCPEDFIRIYEVYVVRALPALTFTAPFGGLEQLIAANYQFLGDVFPEPGALLSAGTGGHIHVESADETVLPTPGSWGGFAEVPSGARMQEYWFSAGHQHFLSTYLPPNTTTLAFKASQVKFCNKRAPKSASTETVIGGPFASFALIMFDLKDTLPQGYMQKLIKQTKRLEHDAAKQGVKFADASGKGFVYGEQCVGGESNNCPAFAAEDTDFRKDNTVEFIILARFSTTNEHYKFLTSTPFRNFMHDHKQYIDEIWSANFAQPAVAEFSNKP